MTRLTIPVIWLWNQMLHSYPATYFDARGREQTTIQNDGETLRTTIRGVRFEGSDFDGFEPEPNTPPKLLNDFSLNHNELCSCRIQCEIPIPLHDNGIRSDGRLLVNLVLGDPEPKGWLDREELSLTLACNHGEFSGSGNSGWFEDELIEIQSKLPRGTYIMACITCLYSDYSPYGHGAFGCMMCFRNLKTEYLNVKSKEDFWSVHNHFERTVQETFLCNQFERRIPGTGYRG